MSAPAAASRPIPRPSGTARTSRCGTGRATSNGRPAGQTAGAPALRSTALEQRATPPVLRLVWRGGNAGRNYRQGGLGGSTAADVARAAEAQDGDEDRPQQEQPEAEAHAPAEGAGKVEHQADQDEDIEERHAQAEQPPARAAGDVQ